MKDLHKLRESERGSAGAKFAIFMAAIVLLGHAAYNYVPVAYSAESMRSEMQTAVVQGVAMPGRANPVENVKARIRTAARKNDTPADTVIDVRQKGSVITAHVVYAKEVSILPFGMFTYNYQFDHTATPTGFLVDQAP